MSAHDGLGPAGNGCADRARRHGTRPRLRHRASLAACAPALGIVALGTHVLLRPTPGSGGTSLLSALARMPHLYCQRRLLVLYLATMTLLGSFVGVFTAIAIGGVSNAPHSLLVLRVAGLSAMLAVPFLVAFLQRFPSSTARPRAFSPPPAPPRWHRCSMASSYGYF